MERHLKNIKANWKGRFLYNRIYAYFIKHEVCQKNFLYLLSIYVIILADSIQECFVAWEISFLLLLLCLYHAHFWIFLAAITTMKLGTNIIAICYQVSKTLFPHQNILQNRENIFRFWLISVEYYKGRHEKHKNEIVC
jgi:hypothetical protein